MTDLDPISPAGYAAYKLLSALSGKGLKQVKLEELRERRKKFLESNEVLGGPPFRTKHLIESLIDMGLEEAEYMPNFDPDLCIVSREQYREIANIAAAVPLNPDKALDIIPGADVQGLSQIQPPYHYSSGNHSIFITYSDATDRMLLVESDALSETVSL